MIWMAGMLGVTTWTTLSPTRRCQAPTMGASGFLVFLVGWVVRSVRDHTIGRLMYIAAPQAGCAFTAMAC